MQFYVLKKYSKQILPGCTEYLRLSKSDGEAMACPTCGQFTSMLPWLPPYRAELELSSDIYGDLAFAPGEEFLVSERFRGLYHEQGLTGLEGFDPVEIVTVKHSTRKAPRTPPPAYYVVRAVHSRTAIDIEESGLEGEGPVRCPECLDIGLIKRTRRVVIDPVTWTGEDVFRARGLTGTIITSERFKIFCDMFKITNAILIPGLEYAFDFYPNEEPL